MPGALKGVEWDKIRDTFMSNSMSFKELGHKFGINPETIRKRATRDGWIVVPEIARKAAYRVAQTAVSAHVGRVLEEALPATREAVHAWLHRSHAVASGIVDKVSKMSEEADNPDALRTLAGALDTSDRVGRRALGLRDDAQQPSGPVQVQVHLSLAPGRSAAEPITIDVDSEPVAPVPD
jgi:hypothetical protein